MEKQRLSEKGKAARTRSQGAEAQTTGVHYRTWCEHKSATVVILDSEGKTLRELPLEAEGEGYFSALDAAGRAGDRYRYRFDDEKSWPDPASRWQPEGVHGPSMVIDPGAYAWKDEDWSAPPYSRLVIYELHVGTFTPAGTFQGAIERLDYLVALGVNAIELMPVADFPGKRNWGYDGVMLYAPACAYGHPDDLRALVEAAHARGLAVILDVVYNHLGPDGNYTSVYHQGYSDPDLKTPWGAALNYAAEPVRAFFAENAPYWRREFHIDGFRLDATHEIADQSPRHLLAEIAEAVHSLGGFVVAEDDRNEPQLLLPPARGGLGLDGAWADDFHHILRVLVTGEREGYYANFKGTSAELAEAIAHGWLYRGQKQATTGLPRGGDTAGLTPPQFVFCISNHDQVGNRAFGERLGHIIAPEMYRAVSALLCLVPQTPLLFMGQEWSASTPFQFFTDHNHELGQLVTAGRRQEFRHFAAFRDPKTRESIPDPQAESTFTRTKLSWEELTVAPHAGVHALYQQFLALRQTHPAWRDRSLESWPALALGEGVIAFRTAPDVQPQALVVCDLREGLPTLNPDDERLQAHNGHAWRLLLSSNDERFGGDGTSTGPVTLVLEAT